MANIKDYAGEWLQLDFSFMGAKVLKIVIFTRYYNTMIHAVRHFIKHLFKSRHLHGIHSPFIYTLQRQCFYKKTPAVQLAQLKAYRKTLSKDPEMLVVADHGAGSKVFKSQNRKVQALLKNNSTPLDRAALLARCCAYFNVKTVLELGTSLGVGTHALALHGAQVTTIEASQQVHDFAAAKLRDLENVKFIHGTFSSFLKGDLREKPQGSYDLIFIDGHHDGAATQQYFEDLLPYTHDHTVFILDDIYWSAGMTAAWKQLQKHPSVTASIDTFYMGFLFLRKEQQQQAFYVKL